MKKEVRKTISLSVETWEAIADYRFENRISTEAEAIRRAFDEVFLKRKANGKR